MTVQRYRLKRMFYADAQRIRSLREHFIRLEGRGFKPKLWNADRICTEANSFLCFQRELPPDKRIDLTEIILLAVQIGRWEASLEWSALATATPKPLTPFGDCGLHSEYDP